MPLNSRLPFLVLAVTGLLTLGMPAAADVLLAQNEDSAVADKEPAPGSLVIPGEKADSASGEKKCMTVCARWGEECTYINRGTGGTTRKCRRTCKQFTEECF